MNIIYIYYLDVTKALKTRVLRIIIIIFGVQFWSKANKSVFLKKELPKERAIQLMAISMNN